jgi:hypothetical protein
MNAIRKTLLLAALVGAPVSLAQAQFLETTLANNGSGGVFIDLTTASGALLITSFDSYFSSTAGGASTIEIYTRPGTYVGFDDNPAGWTLHDTVNAISAGTATLAPITLNTPIAIPASTMTAVYIQPISGQALRYTGTAAIPPQTTWSNADLTLFSDVARTGSVAFGGTRNTPRTFAGVVYYIPSDPTPGACCFNDGTCASLSHADCITQSGVFHGPNTTCAATPCPQPAACCFPSGACEVMLETACTAQGGTFNPAAPTCATANCPQPPTGGCCLPDGTCAVIWEGGCIAQGGSYGGDNTTCATANCDLNVVVPLANATVEGASNNNIPFSTTVAHYRYQQVHAASEFAALSGPHRITGMRMRPNANSTYPAWTNTFDLDLRFSTTPNQPDALSATFVDNIGLDETIVYNGEVTISTQQSSASPFPPGPMLFDIAITFQTPFIYDPANGNLLMDATKNGSTIGTSRAMDAVSVVGDPISRVISSVVGSPTGTASTAGLVVQFLVEPAGSVCYPNCDGSTIEPILNVADFSCFLGKFAAGDPYANCDGSTIEPVLNVADFSCFLGKFAAGCR